MSDPIYRDVRICEHGVKNSTFKSVVHGMNFWIPECNNGKGTGHMKPHIADDRYPIATLTPPPRKQRSDKGKKRK